MHGYLKEINMQVSSVQQKLNEINAQLNTLLSQKKLLEEGVADSASTSQGSNNEELQNKIDNIKLQRLELS